MKFLIILLIFYKTLSIGHSLAESSHITLYVTPSPYGIDWSHPRSLLISLAKNYFSFRPRFMGHVYVEIDCQLPNKTQSQIYAGMVARNLNAKTLLLKEAIGMGIVFHSFPGKLENKSDIADEINQRLNQPDQFGKISFIRFKINEDHCQRVTQYHQEFYKYGLWKYYGLYNDPLKAQGAGCSAFGASFLRVAGIMSSDIESGWTYSVNIPIDLIGMPVFSKRVWPWQLFFAPLRWAKETEPHKKIHFWDPDRMFSWLTLTAKKDGEYYQQYRLGQSQGILVDVSESNQLPEKIWNIQGPIKPYLPIASPSPL